MPKKIEDIKEIIKPIDVVEEDTTISDFATILTPEARQEAVEKLDKALTEANLSFYAGLLGFTDLFNAVFVSTMAKNVIGEEDRAASNARVNDLRLAFTNVLNLKKTNFIAEDVVVLLSLVSEAVIIAVSEEDARMKSGEVEEE